MRIQFLDEFLLLSGSLMDIVSMGYGTWTSHAISWIEWSTRQKIPTLVVSFEQTRNKPRSVLRAIETFLFTGVNRDNLSRVDIAEKIWTLENTRLWEENAIKNKEISRFFKPFLGDAYSAGWRYHGPGRSNYMNDKISADYLRRIHEVFDNQKNYIRKKMDVYGIAAYE